MSNHFALPLCILIAQTRDSLIFNSDTTHLKHVSQLYDECHSTFVEYVTFLTTHLSTSEYKSLIPSLRELCNEFHLPAEAAFFLLRPTFAIAIEAATATAAAETAAAQSSSSTTAASPSSKGKVSNQKLYALAVRSALAPTLDDVRGLHPDKVWAKITPKFFMTFWSLSLYDLTVPTERYELEVTTQRAAIAAIDDNPALTSDTKRRRERERITSIISQLQLEREKQETNHTRVLGRLRSECAEWISDNVQHRDIITQFLQLCVYPRVLFSAPDALYCDLFVQQMHKCNTPNFLVISYYDRVISDITCTLSCCTENEAGRYGRFLAETLAGLMRWHSDQALYDAECANHTGFAASKNGPAVSFENFRHLCHKWHIRMSKAFLACLQDGEYMQTRNCLIILNMINAHFPRLNNSAAAILKRYLRLIIVCISILH